MSKFKVGDKVKVVKKGRGEHSERVPGEFENSWVDPMDGLFEQERTVVEVGYNGVYFQGFDYGFPPAALELVEEKVEKKHQYKEGDKVIFLHLEEGRNKEYDEERFTLGKVYVVYDDYGDTHIRVIDDNNYTAYACKDQVKLVQEEEVEEIKAEVQGDKEEKYTVSEVFEALNEMDETYLIHMTGEVEAYLKKKQDPEWAEFQRLIKKFEA